MGHVKGPEEVTSAWFCLPKPDRARTSDHAAVEGFPVQEGMASPFGRPYKT
ncbi:hypothetical protein T10_7503 [Trichinella papuae]|uniref:Uncharacterized protein n=1 Tax=Trichinella papuae TaxID=268474 RepID=A0A0V1M706_9BILA|nr:hypothetical protein T10_7503 [Trichinella papuae]